MKKKFFTPIIMIALIFILTIVMPALATCPPDDPNCESSTEATGSVYDQFNKNFGDTDNGGTYAGEGFENLFARGNNLAEVNGQIDSQGSGELAPDNLSAWSKAKMEFTGTTTHDTPGEGGIGVGGEVCENSFNWKDNGTSYAGADQIGTAGFEGAKSTDFQAMIATCGRTQIGFVSEAGHEKAMADAENRSLATQNSTGATNTYAANQIVGGVNMGPTVAQFSGKAGIGNCEAPVWTKGTGSADITQTMTPTSYTSKAQVFAREETGTGIKPE